MEPTTTLNEKEQTDGDSRTPEPSTTKPAIDIAEQPDKESSAPLRQIEQKVWNVRTVDLPKSKAVPLAIERVLLLTGKNFIKNKCGLRASSLTFLTLMSVVPLVALLLGIARGFNFEKILRGKLVESFVGQEDVAKWILDFAETTLEVAAGGIITGIGVAMLFFTALKLLANIESSFNDIWGIKQGRPLLRKLSDYITLLFLCPVFAVLLLGLNTFGMARIEGVQWLPGKSYLLDAIRYVFPVVLSWVMFFFLYLFIPNTRVKPKAALWGAILTGTLLIITQYIYMFLQTILTSYNKVYGSFAALPFFLLWLQATWTVILLGAQFSFAVQNVNYYEYYPGDQPLCMHYRSICALRIMKLLGEAFNNRTGAVTITDISGKLEIPIRIARAVLNDLITAGLVIEVTFDRRRDDAFMTKVPLGDFIPTTILERLSNIGDSGYRSENAAEAEKLLADLWESAKKDPANTQLVTFTPEAILEAEKAAGINAEANV
ncbi:MAG: YihY/virulence factor BrkB family protein [Lentisphaeria bacterium]|nr:YihY/virulence factor BrkB family protein [Lentisphaeria bacterium]